MFIKQVRVNGKYVKGIIIDGQLRTNQLVTIDTSKPIIGNAITSSEIQDIIEELQMVKKEMES